MIKKALGGALAALLVTTATAASAAQPVRPSASLVSANGVKVGIRTSAVKKGDSAMMGGLGIGGTVIIAAGLGLFLFGAIKASDDDNDSPE